jgi:Flp pilus assembly protein TadG
MRKTNRRKERGQTLVEFALTLPVLLLVLIGIIDFGRVFFTYAEASNSLRQALRQAPNVGFGTGIPSYRDCDKIEDLANNVTVVDVEITIEYFLGNSTTPVDCGAVTDSMISNGDRMRVTSTAEVEMYVMPITLDMNFIGQRTIIKTLNIGASTNDLDYDGLDDGWERANFAGRTDTQNALGDYDCDGSTNGAEETAGTDPKTPMSC